MKTKKKHKLKKNRCFIIQKSNHSLKVKVGKSNYEVSFSTWSVFLFEGRMKPRNWSSETARLNRACSFPSSDLSAGFPDPDSTSFPFPAASCSCSSSFFFFGFVFFSLDFKSELDWRKDNFKWLLYEVTIEMKRYSIIDNPLVQSF